MIVYTNNDKNLVVPCSLGNISTGSGGSGVTPEDVEIMIDQAIDTYDEGIQEQFNSTNTAVSGNTENIEAISAETQSIANDLDSLGNSVENLSAVTSGISNDLSSLGNDVEELSGVTSGIATDLETLSANTTVVSWEQSLSAGTQIAQITINGQSQSVFAPEGGGDSNYVIVDALSAITNPVEGMIAYIPAHSETFTGLSIESSQVAYQAQLKKSAPRDIAYTISAAYSIGTDNNASSSFYFDSGNWTPMYRKNVWLQYDDANQKTKIVCRDGYTIECFLSQEYYEAITTSFTVDEQVFIYKNNKWYPFEDGKISFYLNNVNTQAKWTDFINEINRLAPGSFQYVYDWFNFDWSTIKFNTLSKPQYNDGITVAYGTSYLFKASNGETFDILNAYSLRIDNSAGWKNIAFATQAGIPIASDSTLGGVKVGSGLTIDGNGVLSADGGGGDSNYVIVDALSAITNPVEGMIAYVSGRTYTEVIEGYKCQRNRAAGNEGDVARIYLDGNELARVYQSGANFHWDWTNDGLWNTFVKEYNGNHYPIEYKTYNDESDNMNSYFIFEKSLGGLAELGATVTPEGGDQATVTDYSEDAQKIQISKFYQYKGSEWQRLDVGDEYILDDMTTAERVVLFNALKTLWDTGERDFSQFKIYSYPNSNNSQIQLPWLLQFYNYNTVEGGRFYFSTAAARWDWARAINGFRVALTYDGNIVDKSMETLEPTAVFKYTLLRDRDYLAYTKGTFSGYTFDATNVGTDVTVCELSAGGNWLFRVYKDGNGELVDGDWNAYTNDNEWHYKERAYDIYSLKCEYKRTGQTITVAFFQGGPASASEMQFNENVTYSETTSSLDIFATNDGGDIFYTGNTCSTEYKFEEGGIKMFLDGNLDNRIPEPLFNFRFITAEGETRYANPVVSYKKVPTTVLYDADGNAFNFNERFFFNYGSFTVSLFAGDGNDYRYAQLTVTAN